MIADRKEERTVNDYLIFHYISCFSSTRYQMKLLHHLHVAHVGQEPKRFLSERGRKNHEKE